MAVEMNNIKNLAEIVLGLLGIVITLIVMAELMV